MKHITKNFNADIVKQHDQDLKEQKLDEHSLLQRKNNGEKLSSKDLYKQVRSKDILPHFYDLLRHIYEEQGGLCCYCGAKLAYPDTKYYSVEHVNPRSKYIELVGEYKNLLLSCHISDDDHKEMSENVSLLGITGKRKSAEMLNRIHCDEHKADEEIKVSPLDKSCESHFAYKINGAVLPIDRSDNAANDTIKVLNLNCSNLIKLRRVALESYIIIDMDEENNTNYLLALKRISDNVMQKDSNGMNNEFCFVIKSVVDDLLNSKP